MKRNGWKAWSRFLSRRESATTLGVFRILVGLVTLYSLASAVTGGVVDLLWVGKEYGGIVAGESGHWIWRLLDGPHSPDGSTPAHVWTLLSAVATFALLSTLGVGGRWPLFLTQQTYLALVSLNPHSSGGYDVLITTAWLLLFCSRCTETLSVDCFRRTGSFISRRKVPAWPRYLLFTQVLVMYTATGFQKVGLSWTPMGGYTALHYVLHDPTWTRFPPDWVAAAGPLLRVMTAVTWHWEQLSFLMLPLLYFRLTKHRAGRVRAWCNRWDWRVPWALIGVGMHVGILLLMNVGPFSWISMSYYVTLWSGGELDRLLTQVRSAATTTTPASQGT